MAVNDDIRDDLLRHQIGIRRLSVAEVNKIIRKLERAQKGLRRELARRIRVMQAIGYDRGPISTERLEVALRDLAEIRKAYARSLYQTLARDLEEIGVYEQGFAVDIIRKAVPAAIALDLGVASTDLIRAIVRSRPFQGRLLRHHFSKLVAKDGVAARRMREAIEEGLISGRPLMGIVRNVNRTALGLERRAVTALVHTAVHHVTGYMRDEVAKLNSDIVEAQQWLATLDQKTCEICLVRDGHTYHPETHEPLDDGPPWDAGPGRMHFNDRCDATYVLKSWKDMGIDADELTGSMRASMNGQVPAETTAEDFMQKLSPGALEDNFGKLRSEMFTSGAIDGRDLLGPDGLRPLSLRELWQNHTDELLAAGFEPKGFPGAKAIRELIGD